MFQPEGPARLLLVAEATLPPASALELDPVSASGILGFLIASHVDPEWELENIVVALTARRSGLGKRLLEGLLAAAAETNSVSVFLEVRESNLAARALYESAGFRLEGQRKLYYTNPSEDALLYRKNLLFKPFS